MDVNKTNKSTKVERINKKENYFSIQQRNK